MGYWGAGFYEDDCTLDVQESREIIPDLQKQGLDAQEISAAMQRVFFEPLHDEKEGPLVLAAIADQLRYYDVLPKALLNRVVTWLDKGGDIPYWEQNEPRYVESRKKTLQRLRSRLLSQRKKKRTATPKQWILWQPGQLYALPFLSKTATDLGLQGEYLLIYILTGGNLVEGYQVPECWVKVTKNAHLPQPASEFDSLDFIPLFSKIEAAINQHSSEPFPHQENRISLYNMFLAEAQGSHPPKDLLYLGVYPNIAPPIPDYRLHKHYLGAAWKYLEEYFLEMYRLFYLRQAKWL